MSSRTSEKKIIEVRGVVDDSNGDVDLFNFLRKMHLTGGANGVTVTYKDYVAGEKGFVVSLILSSSYSRRSSGSS